MNDKKTIGKEIEERMIALNNSQEAEHLMRFFKCGKGEYGEGDRFLGIRVPETRKIVKEYRSNVNIEDCLYLTESEWHEIRLAGFLLMIELYKVYNKSHNEKVKKEILNHYLSIIERGNNWDLVDLVAPKILGEWLTDHPEDVMILDRLAGRHDSLWHQRVAIVATWTLIRDRRYDVTLRISERFLDHKHDLIHKATGWMLREVGKRGGKQELIEFLNKNASIMPRTMLRYAIERFEPQQRKSFMKL